jgi:hypothetical protein
VDLVNSSYCPSRPDYTFRRRLSEAHVVHALAGATDRSIAASTELTHTADGGSVRSRFTGVNDAGSWRSFDPGMPPRDSRAQIANTVSKKRV